MTYGLQMLAEKVGHSDQTLRLHIRNGWLKAEKIPGATGWRVSATEARRWAAKYFCISIATTPMTT